MIELGNGDPIEPLRDRIGRAIYEEPSASGAVPDWYALSEQRRERWRRDADRVIATLRCPDCGSPMTGRTLNSPEFPVSSPAS